MIPKKIHYCWFGRAEMPPLAKKCILSWRKHLPDYEFIEWNEDNFDIKAFPYAREAYEQKKYAFVSDVARLFVLYHEGGVYLDTDVELLKPLEDFLHHEAFCGYEADCRIQTGLLAAHQGNRWIKLALDWYEDKHFVRDDGTEELTPNVDILMQLTQKELPIVYDNTYAEFPQYFTIYPQDYFSPGNWKTKEIVLTDRTICIHHYAASWKKKSTWRDRCFRKAKRIISRIVRLLIRICNR